MNAIRVSAAASLFAAAALVAAPAEDLTVLGARPEMVEQYLTAIARRYWANRQETLNRLRTPADVAARQAAIRRVFEETAGGWPARTPLNVRLTGTLELGRFRIEKLIYESQPGFYVTANLYLPKEAKPPFPAVLGVAGHSVTGKAADVYQTVWRNLALRGFAVLAIDPPGQGERLEYLDETGSRSRIGAGTPEHTMAGLQCLLTGWNYARFVIWDGIRGIDYLASRPDIDAGRLGVAGNSGGGTQAAYLAAVDSRLQAAVSSCYITSWERLWTTIGPPDAEQNLRGFVARGFDFSDYLIAFAPRPFLIASAERDYFPIEGARASYAEARRVYALFGKEEAAGHFVHDSTHGWSGPQREASYRWMERWLAGRREFQPGEESGVEPEEALRSTQTGQVATSLKGETVRSLNAKEAARLEAGRTRLHGAGLREQILKLLRLDWRGPGPAPAANSLGKIERGQVVIEKLAIETEAGIVVPALYFRAQTGPPKRPGVVYADSEGKQREAGLGGAAGELARHGLAVLSIDARGWGETRPLKQISHYELPYKNFQRALHLERTMTGLQTFDVLRSIDWLAARSDVDARRIGVFGKGLGGVAVLYAAALDSRVKAFGSYGAPESYRAITEAETHRGLIDAIVPGVLRAFDLPELRREVGGGGERWFESLLKEPRD